MGKGPGRLRWRIGMAPVPCCTKSAMGVPWLVMTTRMPALACFVRRLSFAFASRKGAVFSLGSCAVFRMDILQSRPHVVTLQLHSRRPNGYSCSLSPQAARKRGASPKRMSGVDRSPRARPAWLQRRRRRCPRLLGRFRSRTSRRSYPWACSYESAICAPLRAYVVRPAFVPARWSAGRTASASRALARTASPLRLRTWFRPRAWLSDRGRTRARAFDHGVRASRRNRSMLRR
jgi:hypothetical protein